MANEKIDVAQWFKATSGFGDHVKTLILQVGERVPAGYRTNKNLDAKPTVEEIAFELAQREAKQARIAEAQAWAAREDVEIASGVRAAIEQDERSVVPRLSLAAWKRLFAKLTAPVEEIDKRDPPKTGVVITPQEALVYWITMLQTYAQYNGEVGMLMVKGYDADNSAPDDEDYTELDIWNDDPTNLTDGTWTEPIVTMQDEGE